MEHVPRFDFFGDKYLEWMWLLTWLSARSHHELVDIDLSTETRLTFDVIHERETRCLRHLRRLQGLRQ